MKRQSSSRRPARRTDPGAAYTRPQRNISLLFDVFVLNQRLRELLSLALADTGMRADQYAVYSLLFEAGPLSPSQMATKMGMPLSTLLDYLRPMLRRGHASRDRHPRDGRAYLVSLTDEGLDSFHRASAAWNAGIGHLEPSLRMPVAEVRRALHALDDAANLTLQDLLRRSMAEAS